MGKEFKCFLNNFLSDISSNKYKVEITEAWKNGFEKGTQEIMDQYEIDDDDYGYCETCGIEIGIRRLEARPTATLCIDCKTLDEIREKHINN